MKKRVSFLVKDECFLNNRFFARNDSLMRDGLNDRYIAFYDLLTKFDIEIGTQDLVDPRSADLVIMHDFSPKLWNLIPNKKNIKKYLLAYEPQVVNNDNWKTSTLALFDRVFTWNLKLINNKHVIWLPLSMRLEFAEANWEQFRQRIFCGSVYSFKPSSKKNSLYNNRLFDTLSLSRLNPGQVHLYGQGWSRIAENNLNIIGKLSLLFQLRGFLPSEIMSIYRGTIEKKNPTLRQYKFSLCYENMSGVSGFVTEKLFDVMKAGSIPIYLGAQDITDLVPESCYIDRRKFRSIGNLNSHLHSFNSEDYNYMLMAQEKFVKSHFGNIFQASTWAKTLGEWLLRDLDLEQ